MPGAKRLVTFVDVDDQVTDTVSVSARHEVELTDGSRVLLLGDRGWGSTRPWTTTTAEEVRETTRMVVGPDEPFGDRSPEDMATDHWAYLRQVAQRRGVAAGAADLEHLPHEIVLGPRVLARIDDDRSP